MFTQEFVTELITCPKLILEPPREVKETHGGYTKKAFTLVSVDQQYNFNGFITQSVAFPENFSVGLIYNPKTDRNSITLIRCNGPHGGTHMSHHSHCHIHMATAERINAGLKPEGHIELTEAYAALADAVQFYLRMIAVTPEQRQKHFPIEIRVMNLFDGLEIQS
jgi:hypothetical protein